MQPGDDLAALLATAVPDLRDGDVLVVTSKIVSKAEGQGRSMAREDAIDAETVRVVASRGNTRIVETRHGLVMAAAGVDASNVERGTVVLLPVDPDASARRLRAALAERLGVRVAVIVSDTMGRPWREGLVDVAIGCAGLHPVDDLRGQTDAFGNELGMTVTAIADELAAAGELVKGKLDGVPVALIRGAGAWVGIEDGPGSRALVRSAENDMFRLGTAEAIEAGQHAALAAIATGDSVSQPAGAPPSSQTVRDAMRVAVAATDSWPGEVSLSILDDLAVRSAVCAVLGTAWDPYVVVAAVEADQIKAGATAAALLIALGMGGAVARWRAVDAVEAAEVQHLSSPASAGQLIVGVVVIQVR